MFVFLLKKKKNHTDRDDAITLTIRHYTLVKREKLLRKEYFHRTNVKSNIIFVRHTVDYEKLIKMRLYDGMFVEFKLTER